MGSGSHISDGRAYVAGVREHALNDRTFAGSRNFWVERAHPSIIMYRLQRCNNVARSVDACGPPRSTAPESVLVVLPDSESEAPLAPSPAESGALLSPSLACSLVMQTELLTNISGKSPTAVTEREKHGCSPSAAGVPPPARAQRETSRTHVSARHVWSNCCTRAQHARAPHAQAALW